MGNAPTVCFSPAVIFDDAQLQVQFVDALQQWYAGNGILLSQRFPEVFWLLELSPQKDYKAIIDKSFANRKETAEKDLASLSEYQAEYAAGAQTGVSAGVSANSPRPFDIISRYNDLLKVEDSMIEQDILDRDKKFIPSRRTSNKRCLAGIYRLLIRNGYFKKFDGTKPGKNKKVTPHDIINFLNTRYGILHFQELKRKGNYEELAALRLPIIEILERGRRF